VKRKKEDEMKIEKEYRDDVRVKGEHIDMKASISITGFSSSKK